MPDRVYLDNFPQIPQANGEAAPKANEAIDDRVNQGSFIINFTGHGGEIGWMDEQVLDLFMIERWNNSFRLPLFVTATCEFSRHDDPRRISGGERVVTNENGGGIAIISTCRPVFANSNFELNRSFYEYVFNKENGEYLRLGDIFRLTKNESIDLAIDSKRVGNRNFALLGDPSLRLSYPENEVVINSINGLEVGADTLNSLSRNIIRGEIQDPSGSMDESFNGIVEVSVFDKEVQLTTLGNRNNIPFNYESFENIIFKGEASVINGEFEVEFQVPKNIAFRYGDGLITFYAKEENGIREANGANNNIIVGGAADPEVIDNEGPEISLFMEAPFNERTRDISHNTTLYANLIDESGINLSSFGTGNNITAELDNDEVFVLNEFYTASQDTFQEGWVSFPLTNLSEGRHSILFKASDTFNNSSEETIEFVVANPQSLLITDLINRPNPFDENTTFSFNHNRAGEDLEVNLQIFNRIGSKVLDYDFEIDNSEPRINLYNWSGENLSGTKFESGIYLYKIIVRSKLDGAKSQEFQKLILFN
ncbi:MAG: type IX secretion system sortase PorU [Bacteroidota bacterium]